MAFAYDIPTLSREARGFLGACTLTDEMSPESASMQTVMPPLLRQGCPAAAVTVTDEAKTAATAAISTAILSSERRAYGGGGGYCRRFKDSKEARLAYCTLIKSVAHNVSK